MIRWNSNKAGFPGNSIHFIKSVFRQVFSVTSEDLAPDVCFVGFKGKLTDSNGTKGKLLDSVGFVGVLDIGPSGTIGVLKSLEGFSGKLTDSDGFKGKLTDTEGFKGELCDC